MSSLLLHISIFCCFYSSDDAGPKTALSMMLNLSQDLRGPHQPEISNFLQRRLEIISLRGKGHFSQRGSIATNGYIMKRSQIPHFVIHA